jgi:hypothetical protein
MNNSAIIYFNESVQGFDIEVVKRNIEANLKLKVNVVANQMNIFDPLFENVDYIFVNDKSLALSLEGKTDSVIIWINEHAEPIEGSNIVPFKEFVELSRWLFNAVIKKKNGKEQGNFPRIEENDKGETNHDLDQKYVEHKPKPGRKVKKTQKEDRDVEIDESKLKKENKEETYVREESIQNPETEVHYQGKPFLSRSRLIEKQAFSRVSWDQNKTIGIWSPLGRMGVTSFIMSYALFLGKQRIHCAVLEGLNKNHILKDWLKRYTQQSKSWNSYASALHEETADPQHVEWIYQNVYWLPLDDQDVSYEWDTESLDHFMGSVKLFDVVFVDFPTGVMEEYTKHSLSYIDELWILVDDNYQQILSWKNYLNTLKKNYSINMKLVFNRHYDFSQSKRIEEALNIPLIATLPPLHEEMMKNYYETKPLIDHNEVYESLLPSFVKISEHLMGPAFTLKESEPKITLLNRVRGRMGPLKSKKNHGMI